MEGCQPAHVASRWLIGKAVFAKFGHKYRLSAQYRPCTGSAHAGSTIPFIQSFVQFIALSLLFPP